MNRTPFQQTPKPDVVNGATETPVQVVPFVEYAISFVDEPAGWPTTTHVRPFHAMPYAEPTNPVVSKTPVIAVQPDAPALFVVYAIQFEPWPVATQYIPFVVTAYPVVENVEEPMPVHVIELDEYASVFVPCPVATHELPFQAIPLPDCVKTVDPRPNQMVPFCE